VSLTCTPASGSTFTVGQSQVQCAALDSSGARASCSFAVVVTRPPQLSITRFMAFGDSLTWGDSNGQTLRLAFPEAPPSSSYPSQLEQLLKARYLDQTVSVANEGWPGELIATGLARIPSAMDDDDPQVLLLLHGANDLLDSPSSAATRHIADNLYKIISRARQHTPDLIVLLATFPPQTEGTDPYDRGRAREFLPELNDRIRAVAEGEDATLVDLYSAFPSDLSTYISSDGLHPLPRGYALIAETFASAIQRVLEQKAQASRLRLR
jgi:acyl-CoA thioesterase I